MKVRHSFQVSAVVVQIFVILGAILEEDGLDVLSVQSQRQFPTFERYLNGKTRLLLFQFDSSMEERRVLLEVPPSNRNVSIQLAGKKSVILIAGFVQDVYSRLNVVLPETLHYVDRERNVFILDWGEVSGASFIRHYHLENVVAIRPLWGLPYKAVVRKVPDVAEDLVKYIHLLEEDYGIQMESDLHVIGHSLGAHIAGLAGTLILQRTGRKISRITGLDPAGPEYGSGESLLNHTCASFVDLYHTNRGLYGGSDLSDGHLDVFVNGGKVQPGCGIYSNLAHFCSHKYSVAFYNASIASPFSACSCSASKGRSASNDAEVGDEIPVDTEKELMSCYSRKNDQAECNGEILIGDKASYSSRGHYYTTSPPFYWKEDL